MILLLFRIRYTAVYGGAVGLYQDQRWPLDPLTRTNRWLALGHAFFDVVQKRNFMIGIANHVPQAFSNSSSIHVRLSGKAINDRISQLFLDLTQPPADSAAMSSQRFRDL